MTNHSIVYPVFHGRKLGLSLAFAVGCTLAGVSAAQQEPYTSASTRRLYIVQLKEPPAASYAGGINRIAGTRPAAGARLRIQAETVQRYTALLEQRQAVVLAAVPAAPVLYRYQVVFNGLSIALTDEEVRLLKARPDVAAIKADTPRRLVTVSTPAFLGLDKPDGLWSRLGGQDKAGEDIVIGVVDSGIWPEHPSFADRIDSQGVPTFDIGGTLAYGAHPAHWAGTCQAGEGFTGEHCNNKLIGAAYFDAASTASGYVRHWTEFHSPRDSVGAPTGAGGHGTHTASTAAGNSATPAFPYGVRMPAMSGIAPRARLAAYKVCWTVQDPANPSTAVNGCWAGDSVAAIEQAVRDGVDVINFSISGGGTADDPVEQAFLHATNAGVFVAASAGNDGAYSDVAHVGPWLATVAASTHDRQFLASVTLNNGAIYRGASLNTTALPSASLIVAEDASTPDKNPYFAGLCIGPDETMDHEVFLDPTKVAGKIVICQRGYNLRVNKSKAVMQAGGVGMILVDDEGGLVAEIHSVPTAHVTSSDGIEIRRHARETAGSASIGTFSMQRLGTGPMVAPFSSRGPNRFDPHQMKPDLTAPGVSVLAGVTPGMAPTQRDEVAGGGPVPAPAWAFYDGTSMSSPHVAALAALLRQQHPTWSPAMIKSALMTSAQGTVPDREDLDAQGVLAWGQGSGHVTPNRAMDPGLAFDIDADGYARYLCGLGLAGQCSDDASQSFNLNTPSITIAELPGTRTITRRVTNVGASPAIWRANVQLPGYAALVAPSTLSLEPGQSATFSVTLRRVDGPYNVWRYGALQWSDGTRIVRIPVQARASRVVGAPALLQSDRAQGMRLMNIITDFTGIMPYAKTGLKEVTRTAYSVVQAPAGVTGSPQQLAAACKAGHSATRTIDVTMPAGALLARFETFERDTEAGAGDDLDMVVLRDGALLGSSVNAGANERVMLMRPAAGKVQVCVAAHASANGEATQFILSSAVVGPGDANDAMKVKVPTRVYAGKTATVGVSWSGLTAGKRYLGAVQLHDSDGTAQATTEVSIDTGDPLPLPPPTPRASSAVAL